ncbi:hypothetical protein [Hymenobacter sp. NBH84]|uniref:hypothetical protein n=1 Tax=Hymenobacter sp. NBH84 TaxID=2596915 RepID=UPI0016259ED1|nr:hypothetical protein [Hymenobacter sp. NBH84]
MQALAGTACNTHAHALLLPFGQHRTDEYLALLPHPPCLMHLSNAQLVAAA